MSLLWAIMNVWNLLFLYPHIVKSVYKNIQTLY